MIVQLVRKSVGLVLAISLTAVLANNAVWAQSLGAIEQAMDPKHKHVVLVNNQSTAAEVFITFDSSSVINVSNVGAFCDSQSVAPAHCHLTLAPNKSVELPNPDFKYVQMALSFNHDVTCGATKAEVAANNPNWYDVEDVSVVDGYNNNIELDATDKGTITPVKLGPPKGKTGNQKIFGVFPFACTQCAAILRPPCGSNGPSECHAGLESAPIPPCQYQINATDGTIDVILQP
jgi:hypothetical protein